MSGLCIASPAPPLKAHAEKKLKMCLKTEFAPWAVVMFAEKQQEGAGRMTGCRIRKNKNVLLSQSIPSHHVCHSGSAGLTPSLQQWKMDWDVTDTCMTQLLTSACADTQHKTVIYPNPQTFSQWPFRNSVERLFLSKSKKQIHITGPVKGYNERVIESWKVGI